MNTKINKYIGSRKDFTKGNRYAVCERMKGFFTTINDKGVVCNVNVSEFNKTLT